MQHNDRSLWLTDIHLDFSSKTEEQDFLHSLAATDAAGLMITGDIATGVDLIQQMHAIAEHFPGQIWFVLGNHDYYGRSIQHVRERIIDEFHNHDRIHWLPDRGMQRLGENTALIGQDGWADGRAGDYSGSKVDLNDFGLIDEFRRKDKVQRLEIMQALSAAETQQTDHALHDALSACRSIILLTHVPPFTSLSLGPDRKVDPDWAPFFCAPSMGERLVEIMQAHSDHRLLVLCGHTHTPAQARVLPNLTVRVGGAQYGAPAVSGVIQRADLDTWFT